MWLCQGFVNFGCECVWCVVIGKYGKSVQCRVVGWVGIWWEVSLGFGLGCVVVVNWMYFELVE